MYAKGAGYLKKKLGKILAYIILFFDNVLKIRSLQVLITLSFIIVTTAGMFFVGVILYNKFSDVAKQNTFISTRQTVDQVNINLDYYIRSMIETSYYQNDIIRDSEDVSVEKITEKMGFLVNSRKDIVSLALFSDKGKLIAGAPSNKIKEAVNILEQDWFKNPMQQPGNLFFSSPHVQNIFEGQNSWVVSFGRAVTFNKGSNSQKGVILLDINFSAIDQLCQKVSLGKRGYIYLIDSKGNIVYHPQQQLINSGLKNESINSALEHGFGKYEEIFNGEKRLVTAQTVNYTGWRIVGIAYTDEIVASKKEIGSLAFWTFLIGLFFVMIISAFTSAKISKPIKRLEKSMKMVEEGRFDIYVDIKGENEVVMLSKAFNIMVAKISNLMEQIVHEQEAKRKSELNALQAQIHPHFLYNTLDSIVWMAENGKNSEVVNMVGALAKLFRISISRGKNVITVQQELEHAHNYLIIQKIRYKSRFKYKIEANEDITHYKTLKLILQPIIENAIYHGIEYMVDEGFINISVGIVDGKLLFQIRDNGLGMSPETIQKILLYDSKTESGNGIGVKNVHERIKLFYGKEYGLEIESEREVGTNVKIWIPKIQDEN